MIKMLTSTAIVAMLAAPVVAQTATAPATATEPTTMAPEDDSAMAYNYSLATGDKSAETFIGKRLYVSEVGKRLYVSEVEVDANAEMTEVDQDWDDVGEISDLVIEEDGQVKAVLTDIGGFLGIGEKTIAVSMDELAVIQDGDSPGDYFTVLTSDRACLKALRSSNDELF